MAIRAIKNEARRKKIAAFIESYMRKNFTPPTLREMAAHVKLSAPAVQRHLRVMCKDGRICRPKAASAKGRQRAWVPAGNVCPCCGRND